VIHLGAGDLMLASNGPIRDRPDWLYEFKLDGYQGPHLVIAFRNRDGDTFRVVEASSPVEAVRVVLQATKIGFVAKRPLNLIPVGGLHGIYIAPN
jgi:hypothetical protein